MAEAFEEFWALAGRGSGIPWTGAGTTVVRPPRGRSHRPVPDARVPPAPEDPIIAVPFGTWSATAPSSEHRLRHRPERELRSVRMGARRLRSIVATLPGRRHGRARRGWVDMRDTLRGGLRHGGEWVELRRQRPRLRRGEFVVMWDVSGSMREHESQCFALAHALAAVSRGARVFAFSTERHRDHERASPPQLPSGGSARRGAHRPCRRRDPHRPILGGTRGALPGGGAGPLDRRPPRATDGTWASPSGRERPSPSSSAGLMRSSG